MNPRRKQTSASPKVFGAGLVALDLVVSADPETPIRAWAGGTCGNVLAILSFLGWDAFPIARLNNEATSEHLKADLHRWGVHLDHIGCEPRADAPIIVQEIKRTKDGVPSHRFRWACLHCGHWLPAYRAVTLSATAHLHVEVGQAAVFFLDRLSPATLQLAKRAAEAGAVVVFEPSAKAERRLMESALATAHVLKYSEQRADFGAVRRPGASVLLEIKTLGVRGLMYRSWLPKAGTHRWVQLPAIPAPAVADTCGSGDWCTAGIIEKLGKTGKKGLLEVTPTALRGALRYSQALAAWNCGFEGARGGMYAVSRRVLQEQVRHLLAGEPRVVPNRTGRDEPPLDVRCPACSVAS